MFLFILTFVYALQLQSYLVFFVISVSLTLSLSLSLSFATGDYTTTDSETNKEHKNYSKTDQPHRATRQDYHHAHASYLTQAWRWWERAHAWSWVIGSWVTSPVGVGRPVVASCVTPTTPTPTPPAPGWWWWWWWWELTIGPPRTDCTRGSNLGFSTCARE